MHIQIDSHAFERAKERGTNEDEIRDVLETGFDVPAKYGRYAKAKVYPFGHKRLGRHYRQKRVEVYYVQDKEVLVIVTVYVFYGQWEVEHAHSL